MKNIFILLCSILPVFAGAQKGGNAGQFSKIISPEMLKKHLYYIAGPETEGRGTGTPGIEKAAAYVEQEFKKAGLQPGNKNSYRINYALYQDSLLNAYIEIDGQNFASGQYFNGDLRRGTNHHIQDKGVVFAGYGIDDSLYSDYKNLDVNGKIVVIVEGEPKVNDTAYLLTGNSRRSEWGFSLDLKSRSAKRLGARALLVLVNNFPRFVPGRRPARGPMYPAFSAEENKLAVYRISDTLAFALFGAEETANLKKTAQKGGSLQALSSNKNITLHFEKKQFETMAGNVIGLLPGTDLKNEYVVITAHMDHLGKRDTMVYYGADDDGSGTCAVIQMAHAFSAAKKAGKGPRRSIVFMTVSGEEMGLWGSDYYARNPVYPLDKTTVNLNIDMIGRVSTEYAKDFPADTGNYVHVIGDDKLSSDLRPISEQANNESVKMKLDYKYNDPKDPNRFYYRSDHYNFAAKGVPIIFYFNGVHKDYHRPSDTPDKINYDLYARRAQLVFHTGWLMANFDRMLKRDIPLNMPARR